MKPTPCAIRATLLLALGACLAPAAAATRSSPPNILFIAVDDLNTRINCYGSEVRAITPNIDRLAARGVRFERAYTAAAICNPSRVATLFGRQPTTTGVYLWEFPRHSPVLREAHSIPQQLHQYGYEAIGIGKIFHVLSRDVVWVDEQSWDDYGPMNTLPRRETDQPNTGFKPGELGTHWFDWGAVTYPGTGDEDMWDYKNARWVEQQLQTRKFKKPFFFAYGTSSPHIPLYVPQKYFDMYPLDKITLPKVLENDLDDLGKSGRDMASNDAIAPAFDPGHKRNFHRELVAKGKWPEAVRAYLAACTFADAAIGVVLDALARSPYADNTIIVLWGDNGWHLGEKGHWQKSTAWSEGVHVPLVVVAPGVTKPGSVCARPVSLVDLYPTLMELSGVPAPAGLDGHSLVPLLQNPAADWPFATLSTHHRPGVHCNAVRKDNWTYLRYANGEEELYEYGQDPLEWHNLASNPAYAAVRAEMAKYLPKTEAPVAQGDNSMLNQRVVRHWPSH